MTGLSQCYYTTPYCDFYQVYDAECFGRKFDLKRRQSCEDLEVFVVWHNIKVFVVPPAMRKSVYVTVL